MAEVFKLSCKCGFRRERTEGFLEADFDKSGAMLPRFSTRFKPGETHLAFEPAPLNAFDKDFFFLSEPAQMTIRERMYLRIHGSRYLPLALRRWLEKILVPYDRRSTCENCGKMTMRWFRIGYAD
jgi:hypothetical protein